VIRTEIFLLSAALVFAVGSASAADKDGSYKLNLNKSGPSRRIFVPVKVQSVFRPAEGVLAGHPFKLARSTISANSVTPDGGDSKIVIEFAAPQIFSDRTYQIRYNTVRALTEKGDVKAPRVIYSTKEKGGAVATVVATNGAKEDKLDYAMELKFYPPGKKGEQHGYIRLQIGTEPVSEVKGDFFAKL